MPKVIIYTDGSCLKNPGGNGGWAAILRHEASSSEREISGGMATTTNNRMEITAVLEGLKCLKVPCEVTVVTDSQYVSNSITKGWVFNWAKKGWRDDKGKPRLNTDLWKQMLELLNYHKVHIQWIRGHQGHRENERCDRLAKAAAESGSLPVDQGYLESIAH